MKRARFTEEQIIGILRERWSWLVRQFSGLAKVDRSAATDRHSAKTGCSASSLLPESHTDRESATDSALNTFIGF